jgi:hypothetical protein
VASLYPDPPGIGLKSQACSALLSGTSVPPFVPPGAAEAAAIVKGNDVVEISRIAAQRVSVKLGRVMMELSAVLTTNTMTVTTARQ